MKVFLFIHPLNVNAAIWLMNGEGWLDRNVVYKEYNGDRHILTVNCDPEPNQPNVNTLGYALAACGYYVWLLNYRGSQYPKIHQYKNKNGN